MSDHGPMQAPKRKFHVGRYVFSRHAGSGLWDVSNGSLGSTGSNPISAFLALKRWEKEPSTPE